MKTIFIICGPTAVGKTSLAIELAQRLQTDIISADSRQCFIELNIGVAKPSEKELAAVHHYFISSHSIHQEVNAAVFEEYALQAAANIFSIKDTAVMVGGTGLYIKAFAEGLDEVPTVDPAIRQQVINSYNKLGLEYLQQQLQEKDPVFWEVAEQQNPQRLMRALEVILSTGRSISSFRTGNKQQRPFNIIKIGLELPREQLYQQVNTRVDEMIVAGLVDEVKALLPYQYLNALQTVGYRELFPVFTKAVTLDTAIEEIKKNTRHYAKRQMTWFKRDSGIHWFHPKQEGLIDQLISMVTN
ncbi:tRNA (adenosine(37)-N6)-dimethylallyltransferase MiaA [Aridibaculum aurantiacum]|uniref:tRNA (adenosine(37)-N6)-dimethylallyltransferase MiaA n=1 Tax=Aridibaculum aurantiacum TaxID=2810307 RepID=UPI001A974BBE|nr:tRNA (adenosine(37)-N6)-dimethylallyltransferase MiaA [Aridibaculum aurantiacum]